MAPGRLPGRDAGPKFIKDNRGGFVAHRIIDGTPIVKLTPDGSIMSRNARGNRLAQAFRPERIPIMPMVARWQRIWIREKTITL